MQLNVLVIQTLDYNSPSWFFPSVGFTALTNGEVMRVDDSQVWRIHLLAPGHVWKHRGIAGDYMHYYDFVYFLTFMFILLTLFQTMLLSFRVSELHMLLGFAGRNKSGRKTELQQRALELLRVRSHPIHQKIRELYKTIQAWVISNFNVL